MRVWQLRLLPCFPGLGWLCEIKARSCLSQIHFSSEALKSGVAKAECRRQALVLMLSRHLSLKEIQCWTWIQLIPCGEKPSHPESPWWTQWRIVLLPDYWSQRAVAKVSTSTQELVTGDVPQGSILWMMLCNAFISDPTDRRGCAFSKVTMN